MFEIFQEVLLNKTYLTHILVEGKLGIAEGGGDWLEVGEEGFPRGPQQIEVNKVVNIRYGSITDVRAGAYVVPYGINGLPGGVAGDISYGGGRAGIVDGFGEIFHSAEGKVEFGTAYVTPSWGGGSRYLIHVVANAAGAEREYQVVSRATYNALMEAEIYNYKLTLNNPFNKPKIDSVVFPTLGFGDKGSLTPEQSAQAVMGGIARYLAEGGRIGTIDIAIFRESSTGRVKRAFMSARESMIPSRCSRFLANI